MPEITLTQAPAHIRMGSSIGQPLTRRDGVLKVTGARPLRRRQPPARHALCRAGGQQHRARPRHRRSMSRPPRRIPAWSR